MCICLYACIFVCMHVCLSFRGNTCQFEIRVERVRKDIVKAFPKGLYGHKTTENNAVGLLGYQVKRILLSESHSYANKN